MMVFNFICKKELKEDKISVLSRPCFQLHYFQFYIRHVFNADRTVLLAEVLGSIAVPLGIN
jgi:hypothetical protein